MARMVPGAEQLPPDELWRLAQQTVRRDFATAVEQATRVPADVDDQLAAIAHDPALSPAHRATTAKADGRGDRQAGSSTKGHHSPHLGG